MGAGPLVTEPSIYGPDRIAGRLPGRPCADWNGHVVAQLDFADSEWNATQSVRRGVRAVVDTPASVDLDCIRLRQWRWLFIDTGDYLPVAANKLSFRNAIQQRRLSTVALKAAFVGRQRSLILFAIRGVSSLAGPADGNHAGVDVPCHAS